MPVVSSGEKITVDVGEQTSLWLLIKILLTSSPQQTRLLENFFENIFDTTAALCLYEGEYNGYKPADHV